MSSNTGAFDAAISKYFTSELFAEVLFRKQDYIKVKLSELPTEQKQAIKLRDQFPFLKESDCPDVLKLIVSDLITSYETYTTNQPLLHAQATQEQLKEVCDTVVENYILNKQSFDELAHYGKSKQLLGVHPIYARLEAEQEYNGKTAEELGTVISNLTNNINRNKKKLSQSETEADKEKYTNLVVEQQERKELATTALKAKK